LEKLISASSGLGPVRITGHGRGLVMLRRGERGEPHTEGSTTNPVSCGGEVLVKGAGKGGGGVLRRGKNGS